jgi:hypothetical protein
MSAELPPDLRTAVHQLHGKPLHLIDPDTNTPYVLIPASLYRPSPDAQADDELADTYPAQQESAFAAGWNEPEMSDYDDYDANRKRLG